jgi:ABC-type nitrate/sulfonate/bicarbonate transport system permease component
MNGQAARRLLALPVWVTRLISVGVFAGVWELAARRGMLNPLFVGQPSRIAVFFLNGFFVDQRFLSEGQWTLAATVVAFALGSAAGILVGLLFVVWPVSERFLEPIFAGPQHDAPDCPWPPCSCCGSGSASGPRLPSPST